MRVYRLVIPLALLATASYADQFFDLTLDPGLLNYHVHGNAGGSSSINEYILASFIQPSNPGDFFTGSGDATGSINVPLSQPDNGYDVAVLEIGREEYVNGDVSKPNIVQYDLPGLGPVAGPCCGPRAAVVTYNASGQLMDVVQVGLGAGAGGDLIAVFYSVVDPTASGFGSFTQNILGFSHIHDVVISPNGGMDTVVGVHWMDGGDQVIRFSSTPEPTGILLLASAVLITLRSALKRTSK